MVCQQLVSVKTVYPKKERLIEKYFEDTPSEELVDSFIEHAKKTSTPDSWKYLTKTKPLAIIDNDSSGVQFLAKFATKNKIPCPCCSPRKGKFNNGVLLYFPKEKIIRYVGEQCYAKQDPEGYEAALKNNKDKKTSELNNKRLMNYLPIMHKDLRKIDIAITVAEDILKFHTDLHIKLKNLQISLNEISKNGELKIGNIANGSQSTFSRIEGFEIFNPSLSRLLKDYIQKLKGTKDISNKFISERMLLEQMSNTQKNDIAKILRKTWSGIYQIVNDLSNIQKFFVFGKTLKKWSSQSGFNMSFTIDYDGNFFKFTNFKNASEKVLIPRNARQEIRNINQILVF